MYLKTLLIIFTFFPLQKIYTQEKTKIDNIFSKQFQYSMISRGDNFPDFSVRKDSIDFLLFCLHEDLPLEAFMKKSGFDQDKVNNITSFLESKNWLYKVGNVYKPSIFIASEADGDTLYKYATSISKDISEAITNHLPTIKEMFSKTGIAKTDSFEQWSFFILSNVLLDSWQIDNVERDFLKRIERPTRHGKHYFQEIVEWNNRDREAFGIYGNQTIQTKDGKIFSIYGNNRGMKLSRELFNNKVSAADNIILEKIAESFLPNLLDILEKYRAYSEQVYNDTGYSTEISYDEFFIWWYHFIYTQATEELATRGVLIIPDNGNFYYEELP